MALSEVPMLQNHVIPVLYAIFALIIWIPIGIMTLSGQDGSMILLGALLSAVMAGFWASLFPPKWIYQKRWTGWGKSLAVSLLITVLTIATAGPLTGLFMAVDLAVVGPLMVLAMVFVSPFAALWAAGATGIWWWTSRRFI